MAFHRALALCLARSVCLSLSASLSLSLSRSPTLALSCSLSWNPNANACTENYDPSKQRSRCARVLEVMSGHKIHQLIIHFSASCGPLVFSRVPFTAQHMHALVCHGHEPLSQLAQASLGMSKQV